MKKFIDYLEMLQNESETSEPKSENEKEVRKYFENPNQADLAEILRTQKGDPKINLKTIYKTTGHDWAETIIDKQWKELQTQLQKLYITQKQYEKFKEIKKMSTHNTADSKVAEKISEAQDALKILIAAISKQHNDNVLSPKQIETLQKDLIIKVGPKIIILPEWLTMSSMKRNYIEGA